MTRVTRDDRTRRDKHALDEHGMVLCNPRDREAAHRAEMEGIATQIFEALNQGGVLGATGLDDFRFAAVKPSGDSGPFLVEVCGVDPLARYEPAAIEAVLREHKGLLRAEVAQSVNRRQAPELRFLVLPPGAQP